MKNLPNDENLPLSIPEAELERLIEGWHAYDWCEPLGLFGMMALWKMYRDTDEAFRSMPDIPLTIDWNNPNPKGTAAA